MWQMPGRYDFSIPEAQWLSDLSGIDADLEAVVRICTRCEKLMKGAHQPTQGDDLSWWGETQALGDLTFAAVVRYGRTFGSGVRKGVPPEWIPLLPKHVQVSHAYFKALRDKYIAHSVNQLEDNQVFVILTPQFAEDQEPTHITVDRGYLNGLDLTDLRRLASLAEGLRKFVADAIETETSKLLAIARSMPLDKVRARSTASVPIPGKAETFKIRKGFKG